jgi:A/G-specific adenine glycosylase
MKPARTVPLLLDWFASNARDLPWRRTLDPYAIWVSEIMLQQTQVKTVVPYWERWMLALPNIRCLARAKPQTIHKLWEGLGYYTRVRNMHKAAELILEKHDGRFPTCFEHVLALPGIGRYTAGAICSIAFNQSHPILDGNVIRVLARLFGIDGNPRDKTINNKLWALAEALVQEASERSRSQVARLGSRSLPIANGKSQGSCSLLNQSLMELGALVCVPRQPRCEVCPVAILCVARKQHRVAALPCKLPRPTPTQRRFIAFVARHRRKFLVRQRPAGVLNAHLWEFPNVEVPKKDSDPERAALNLLGVRPTQLDPLYTIRHSITRYRIRLDVFEIVSKHPVNLRNGADRWATRSELHRLPFASAHAKILGKLIPRPPLRKGRPVINR